MQPELQAKDLGSINDQPMLLWLFKSTPYVLGIMLDA